MATLAMPSMEFHITKAKRNEGFYKLHKLETSDFKEWAIIVQFYISLHYVDAVLSQDAALPSGMQNPNDHTKRKRAIAQCAQLAPIASMYLNLCDRCREARYYKDHFPDDYFNNLVTRVFRPMKAHLANCLNLP